MSTATVNQKVRQAWRLTTDDAGSNELPVSKLLELLRNLETISNTSILDQSSLRIVTDFMDRNLDRGLVIRISDFSSFFENLLGYPLSSKFGNQLGEINLNQNATTNFINRELENLKRQKNYAQEKTYGAQHSRSTDRLPSHGKSKDNNVILSKLREQLEVQNALVNELRSLQKDLHSTVNTDQQHRHQNKNSHTSNKRSFQIPSYSKRKWFNGKIPRISTSWWLKILILISVLLFSLSIFDLLLEYCQDSIMDWSYLDLSIQL